MPQLVVRTLIPEHIQELGYQGIPQNQPETIPITHLEKTDVFFINFDSQSKKTKKNGKIGDYIKTRKTSQHMTW